MKKQFYYIVSILALAVLVNTAKVEASQLFLNREKIEEDYYKEAKNNWKEYINASGNNSDNFYLAEPFTVQFQESSEHYFPIVEKDSKKISYALQVDKVEDEYFVALSQRMANVLEETANEKETKDNPLSLYGNDQSVYYTYKGESYAMNNNSLEENKNINEDLGEVVDITKAVPLSSENYKQVAAPIEFIQKDSSKFKVYETQEEQPWCQKYTYASAINTAKGKKVTSAKELVKAMNPKLSDKDLTDWNKLDKNLNNLIKYINTKYSMNLKMEEKVLPFVTIKKEIDSNSIITTDLNNLTNTKSNGHSINLIGYIAPKNNDLTNYPPYYKYWNPWWADTFTVSSKSSHMNLSGNKYKWFRTTYNFR